MGKLGGAELGYGSDLDLLFVYGDDGQTTGPERVSHPEYFSKLADRVTKILASITAEGAAYRVDSRLRPGGQKGEVAVSVRAFETHFERMAELWERQAYIKARPVAGDPRVGEGFLAVVQRFVYEGPEEPDLAERILAMRHRISAERVGTAGKMTHVKLGSGGIVEIEFLVQYLQLRHGRTHPALRSHSTRLALAALAETGILPAADAATLDEAYRFLRRWRRPHRGDLSVNTCPAPRQAGKAAWRMGYPPKADTFPGAVPGDYAARTGQVHEIFQRVFGGNGGLR
jgi:glutamate-ammonia-ligase adenylyltransferase